MTIRRGVIDDLGALRNICVLTGDDGRDATGRWSDDGLLPDVYLEPYLRCPDGLVWVVDPPGGRAKSRPPIGYLIAVPDTAAFVDWWRNEWVGVFVDRHGRATEREGEGQLFDGGTRPELMLANASDEFPAHLHIDLLPEAQGRGHGRALMRLLGEELVRQGVPGVHLGVSGGNPGAIAFYRRLGFDETDQGDGRLMTAPSARLAAL